MKRSRMTAALLLTALLVSCGGRAVGDAASDYGESVAADARVQRGYALGEDERSLLAWLVACEAGNHPYMAQVCVAAVLLNRLDAEDCDLRELIFEEGDFRSVTEGHVRGEPTEAERSTKKYTVGMMALEEALSGRDPTGGALYFAEADDRDSRVAIGYECGGLVFGK